MVDICSGLGGASRAFVDAGWTVITVDNNPEFHPTICADITELKCFEITRLINGKRPILVWASPPCTEYSRESMPWCKTGKTPSNALVEASMRLIHELRPVYWVIENVKGSVKYLTPTLGPVRQRIGNQYLWGDFPIMSPMPKYGKEKLWPRKDRPAQRSLIPKSISKALLKAIEYELMS